MHRIVRLPLVLLAALALTAAGAQPLVSLPVEDVIDGPIAMSEINATTATLIVTTAIDLACVVVFGPDEGFGQLALDADMGGTAQSDHQVFLRGLEPDTEYAYRLQGSAPDGTFYASEVLRFRTAAAHDYPASGRGQEFTFRVLASSGGNTGVVEVAVYTRPQ